MKAKNQLPPLHIAAATGMSELCKFLMLKTDSENPMEKTEVTIDILEGNGKIVPIYKTQRCTALHLAALNGHDETVKLLEELIQQASNN